MAQYSLRWRKYVSALASAFNTDAHQCIQSLRYSDILRGDQHSVCNCKFERLHKIIMPFQSVPILDLSLADDPATKPAFLADLRRALMEVGFFYIKNAGISEDFFNKVISEGRAFFDIPLEEK